MKSRRKITIKKLAELAGVSNSTVSRALRSDPSISLKTQKRLKRLAKKHGYQKNALVSTLMTQLKIGIQPSGITTLAWLNFHPKRDAWQTIPWFKLFFKGANERANRLGYNLEEFWLGNPGLSPQRLDQILQTRNIRGIVIDRFYYWGEDWKLPFRKYAWVALGRLPFPEPIHRIQTYDYQNMQLCLDQLKNFGFKRIGYACHRYTVKKSQKELLACYTFFNERQPNQQQIPYLLLEDAIAPGNEHPSSKTKFGKWFARYKPEVLVCNHTIFKQWLEEIGLKIPLDISIVNLQARSQGEPNYYAGIDEHDDWIGAGAIDLLVAQLQRNELGVPEYQKISLIKGSWVDGESLRKP